MARRPQPEIVESNSRPRAPARTAGVSRYWSGRICAMGGCTTTLSIYNPDPYCWIHQQPLPAPGRALRP
jgi:hypothetical protein